jgi:NAD(P)H-dependent flavin oxidoreductase YrpB (nitropropane dioxygenase family)
MWSNGRFIKLCGIELPIIQAPMAGSALSEMLVEVSQAGGLGSLCLRATERGTSSQGTRNYPPKDVATHQCKLLLSPSAARRPSSANELETFPLAAATLASLRAKSEMAGSADFTPFWSGQAASLGRDLPAAELTKQLAAEASRNLRVLPPAA